MAYVGDKAKKTFNKNRKKELQQGYLELSEREVL